MSRRRRAERICGGAAEPGAIFPLLLPSSVPNFRAARHDRRAAGLHGAIAQLGERYNGIVEVTGSIPVGSTNSDKGLAENG